MSKARADQFKGAAHGAQPLGRGVGLNPKGMLKAPLCSASQETTWGQSLGVHVAGRYRHLQSRAKHGITPNGWEAEDVHLTSPFALRVLLEPRLIPHVNLDLTSCSPALLTSSASHLPPSLF